MKIIPVYLPQYHSIPENDKWWGKGFTEWTNLKKAKPLFTNHYQPREPLNDYYYDLSQIETLKWQCELAKKYGIYGFCIYHYWFNGHLLLEKPMEMLLKHQEIDINYCICWANHDWSDGWKAQEGQPKILISHDFDDENDWINHFNYLLPFFQDKRYMKENGKPIVVIYIPNIIRKLNKMLDLWNNMAVNAGFPGLCFIYQSAASAMDTSWDRSKFEFGIEFNPGYARMYNQKSVSIRFKFMKYSRLIKKIFGIKKSLAKAKKEVTIYNYDELWETILKMPPQNSHMIPSAFTDWDNTPRHLNNGSVYIGATPEKFKTYLSRLIKKTQNEYKKDMIFIFAWNEWTEGGYLEPDKVNKYGFLEAINDALKENNLYEY